MFDGRACVEILYVKSDDTLKRQKYEYLRKKHVTDGGERGGGRNRHRGFFTRDYGFCVF